MKMMTITHTLQNHVYESYTYEVPADSILYCYSTKSKESGDISYYVVLKEGTSLDVSEQEYKKAIELLENR